MSIEDLERADDLDEREQAPEADGGELDDEDLEQVAGGWSGEDGGG